MHNYIQIILKFTLTALLVALWFSGSCGLIDDVRADLTKRDNQLDQFYYLDSLIKYSDENSNKYFVGYLVKSELQRKEKRNVEALSSLKKIFENPLASEHFLTLGLAYLATSDLYSDQKSYDLAQNYVTEAYIIFDSIEDDSNKSLSLIKSAAINKRQKNYQAALRNLRQAHDLYETKGKMHEATALAEQIGSLAYEAGEFSQAEDYLLKALSGYRNLNQPTEQITVLESLVSICEFDKRYEEKVVYLKKLIIISEQHSKVSKTAARFESLSTTYSKMNLRREALQAQERAVNLLKDSKNTMYYYSLVKLSELYKLSDRETDAIMKLHEANSLAVSLEDDEIIMESTKVIGNFYKEMNEWEKAVKYIALSDSMSTQMLEAKIRRLEKNKPTDITAVFETENEAVAEQIPTTFLTNWKNYLVALCLTLIALVVIVFVNKRKRKKITKVLEWKVYKRTKELRVLNSELNTYIYKSSHDLRNPLTSIKSLITLLKSEEMNPNGTKYITLIEDCANQMDEILLNLSRAVDYKKFEVKPVQIDFSAIKEELTSSEFGFNSGIELSWNIREKAPFFSDPNLIKVILKKTILNSQQYRLGSSKDYCKVSITTDSSGAYLSVEDNGQGISDKVKDSVFNMFVKGTHKSKGAGLGLYLVKIAADKLRGNISLESQENLGSKLIFKLPNLS